MVCTSTAVMSTALGLSAFARRHVRSLTRAGVCVSSMTSEMTRTPPLPRRESVPFDVTEKCASLEALQWETTPIQTAGEHTGSWPCPPNRLQYSMLRFSCICTLQEHRTGEDLIFACVDRTDTSLYKKINDPLVLIVHSTVFFASLMKQIPYLEHYIGSWCKWKTKRYLGKSSKIEPLTQIIWEWYW